MAEKLFLLFLSIMLIASTSFAETFQVDPKHTQIHFSVKHLVIFTAHGNFTDFSGSVQTDPENNSLIAAEATIQTASIDTRKSKRDNYLRGEDFFEVKQYPEIYFKSKKVTGSGNDIMMIGDITIKGVTKEITLQGSFLGTTLDPRGKLRAKFAATGTIMHKDFNLRGDTPNKTSQLTIGDKVNIRLEVESVVQ
ncbi:MAG: polyisoprenoid-binding protein [Desulfuromusa sp.]|nr:polyisoprenoid-binding protein [Desulfuromusa sp.]